MGYGHGTAQWQKSFEEDESMSEKTKKIVNRGGLIAMIVGVIAIVAGGGDPGSAIDTAGTAATIAGTVAVFIRELMN